MTAHTSSNARLRVPLHAVPAPIERAFSVLVIDTAVNEGDVVEHILRQQTRRPVCVRQVTNIREAVFGLCSYEYNLVIVDRGPRNHWGADRMLPLLVAAKGDAVLAVATARPARGDLSEKTQGVDHKLDKADIISFLQYQLIRFEKSDKALN